MPKLPFVGRIYWKILPVVLGLLIATFWIAITYFDYEMTRADGPGSLISGIIFSYLLHLWMLPADAYDEYDDDEYEYEYEDEDEEDSDTDDNESADGAVNASS
ncbi:MAG: hypothetical protein ACPGXK_02470 [Phycisphaerae bacterium]